MTRQTLARLAMSFLSALVLLATAGCDRSQPGPKPISGDSGTAAPGSGGAAEPSRQAPAR